MFSLVFKFLLLLLFQSLVATYIIEEGSVSNIQNEVTLCFSSDTTGPIFFLGVETLELMIESGRFGTMHYSMEGGTCDQMNALSFIWFYGTTNFMEYSPTTQLYIGLKFYKQTCVTFCPEFSEVPFTYTVSSKISLSKIIITIAGSCMFLTAFSLVKRVWILHSLIGLFVGGVLWAYGFIFLLKKVPKIPTHIKYQISLCLLPIFTGSTYGICIYFKKIIILTILWFFMLGAIATYWYGQPSQRSINIIAYTVKLFGLLLICFAQSDSTCLLLLIFFTLIILSELINYLNFYSNYSFGKRFFLITENLRLLKKSQPTNSLKSFPFTYISEEEFNSHYLNTPYYLRCMAYHVRLNPELIRKIKYQNRKSFALFCLDPEMFLSKCSHEFFANDSENEILTNESDATNSEDEENLLSEEK